MAPVEGRSNIALSEGYHVPLLENVPLNSNGNFRDRSADLQRRAIYPLCAKAEIAAPFLADENWDSLVPQEVTP
jgi:hypothetical protein